MFEKIGRLAETAANKVSVSRRGFLGRLGQGALATIGVLGAFVFSQDARAGSSGVVCCKYKNDGSCGAPYGLKFLYTCYPAGTLCPPCFSPVNGGCAGCFLKQSSTKTSCKQCG